MVSSFGAIPTRNPKEPSLPRKYLIDSILPEREISLIAGPAGGGKTTWLFQVLELWQNSVDVHGHASHPCRYVYVSADRSKEAAEATMDRMSINLDRIPLISGVEEDLHTFSSIVSLVRKKDPNVKLIVIDGFATIVPGGKAGDYHTVANFLRSITRQCKREDITVLGIIHAAKTKENEKYLNPRERILGSVAWAGFSETIFFIEPVDVKDVENPQRLLEILPRNAAQEKFELELRDGRFVPSSRRVPADADTESFLNTMTVGEEFGVEELGAKLRLGRSKTYMLLTRLEENRAIERVRRGVYRRVQSPFFPN